MGEGRIRIRRKVKKYWEKDEYLSGEGRKHIGRRTLNIGRRTLHIGRRTDKYLEKDGKYWEKDG